MLQEADLLDRITVRPDVYGGKPIIRDMRIAVEHVLGKPAAGDAAIPLVHYYSNQRGKPCKKWIISRLGAYHGATYVTASLTGIHATNHNSAR